MERQGEMERLGRAQRRLEVAMNHTTGSTPVFGCVVRDLQAGMDQGALKWNGWGYVDTEFELDGYGGDDVTLTGDRYAFSGRPFPDLKRWSEETCGLDTREQSPALPKYGGSFSPSRIPERFLKAVEALGMPHSEDNYTRLHHGHGHTNNEIYNLRYGAFDRLPDTVVFPKDHSMVERLVALAHEHNVVLIPFGGGTSVTEAILCPADEPRPIVSVDMKGMNNILWVNHESMTACVQAGCVGIQLDQNLRSMGYTIGHEPDSFEFSTVGGWVATRASGMKKNLYGNIEDIVVQVRVVTPAGVMMKGSAGPRQSTGPDVHHFVMGSEGILGIITEVVVRIRSVPEVEEYGSIVFPDFESGVAMMREVARQRCAPAAIRLVDNMQFQFGQVLKPKRDSKLELYLDQVKKFYVTKVKHFDVNKMSACTLVFIGSKAEVKAQQKRIYDLAKRFGGISGGSEAGRRGYFLTYMIAYVRDFVFRYHFIAESFETCVPWHRLHELVRRVKQRLVTSCYDHGVKQAPFVSARISLTYETGATVYFYFGFVFKDLDDPKHVFHSVEADARDEVLACGGSLSHHHGIGKLRKKWMDNAVSPAGIEMIKGVKRAVDPTNIFASRNLVDM